MEISRIHTDPRKMLSIFMQWQAAETLPEFVSRLNKGFKAVLEPLENSMTSSEETQSKTGKWPKLKVLRKIPDMVLKCFKPFL